MIDRRPQLPQQLLDRIRAEFLEMPGLRLTREQARRLWGLDDATCAIVLDSLIHQGFLRTTGSIYARSMDGAAPRPAMAKAELRYRRLTRIAH